MMPDNTYFNPYDLSFLKCLSSGPSQGIVYELNETAVIKVPFQYPVGEGSTREEKVDHLVLSLNSFSFFKKEMDFYDLLAQYLHPNIAKRLWCNKPDCMVLEKLIPLKQAWDCSTERLHDAWILELIDVLLFLRDLGYLHGDISTSNMGIDCHNRLKVFDFGSVVHYLDEDFQEQMIDDCFNLATCIYTLASGSDPFAQAENISDVRWIRQALQQGEFPITAVAQKYEEVIRAGWSRKDSFDIGQLKATVSKTQGMVTTGTLQSPQLNDCTCLSFQSSLNRAVREQRWMDEQGYRIAWEKQGFEIATFQGFIYSSIFARKSQSAR